MPWSEEQRRRQADRIQQRKPWIKSTGPRSALGKARSSKNAFKGGHRHKMREFSKLLRQMAAPT
jgi:hypothetical protein